MDTASGRLRCANPKMATHRWGWVAYLFFIGSSSDKVELARMNTIVASVVGGLVLTAIIFIAKSCLGTQPKLRVRILPGSSMSSVGSRPDRIKCSWQNHLELYNSTPFNALGVAFIWPDASRLLPLPQFEPPHANAMETR